MKLRLTEKFLWDIYDLIKIKDGIIDAVIPTHPEHKSLGALEMLEKIGLGYHNVRDYYWENHREKRQRERFRKFINYLKEKGYLNVKDLENRKAIMLTPKGKEKILSLQAKITKKARRQDKKWQMVLFDIPEKSRNNRDCFRLCLKSIGYKKLQQSIWVCPFDVLGETERLIKRYKLERFVRLLLVEEVKI